MADQKRSLLRILVPLGILAVGIGVMWSVYTNTRKQGTQPGTNGPAAATGASGVTGSTQVAASAGPSGPSGSPAVTGAAASGAPAGTPAPAAAFDRLRAMPLDGDAKPFASLGTLDKGGQHEVQIEFSTLGAGIRSLKLRRHFDTIQEVTHTTVQEQHTYATPDGTQVVVPMAAHSVEINGTVVSLLGSFDDPATGKRQGAPVWRELSPGAFEAMIVEGAGRRVARVERRYSLAPGSYDVRVDQKVENLLGEPMTVRWFQYGPVDLPLDTRSYGGDKRRVRFGYLLSPTYQGTDPTVSATEFLWSRSDSGVMGPKGANGSLETVRPIWPNDKSQKLGLRPVWTGLTNRYFGAAVHPLPPAGSGPDAKVFRAAAGTDRILLQRALVGGLPDDPVMVLRTVSEAVVVAGGGSADVSMGLYAGPLSRPLIGADPMPVETGLPGLVVYNFGGPCAWCTFPFLTAFLLWLLRFLHEYVVFDWALAIIVLVLVVRTILHPVTKWSQVRLQRFGKQMQGMAPKQKKIQEKYASDPQKMREEMGRLWREEGVNPTGALGCVPMFLQTPVWIALYATLYFAFDLRHEGAFFGVFQWASKALTGHTWWFLGDLAEPDRFWYFGKVLFTVPLLAIPVDGINVLPVVLGIVFFIQQKYLTPPPTTPLTPEQEQQQKMMKWMMVFMFPALMYGAPSGLALYFIANSTLGIMESRYIRAHIDKYDLLSTPKRERKPGGGGGFMERLRTLAEERQRQMMKAKGVQPPRKKV